MKMIVLSDSHGRIGIIRKIAEAEQPEFVLHLGDYDRDCKKALDSYRVIQVRGNCDYGSTEEEERFLDFGATKIWLTHGHRYQVKSGLDRLIRAGEQKGAAVILYGHTHRSYLLQTAAYTVMNPGTPDETYGIIEIENGKLRNITLKETNFT